MAVHVPLSAEAQTEAWLLMLSSHNILHPAHGRPIAIPSQDMVLGTYYLTRARDGEVGEGSNFGSYEEVALAFSSNEVTPHARINIRLNGRWIKNTTVGRVMFNNVLPAKMPYYNETIDKKKITKIIGKSYKECGNYATVIFLDELKDLGFDFAYKSGLSIAIADIHIPKKKSDLFVEC